MLRRSSRDADLKAGWLATADAALALVKLGADLLIASALPANPKQREGLRNEWLMRYGNSGLIDNPRNAVIGARILQPSSDWQGRGYLHCCLGLHPISLIR